MLGRTSIPAALLDDLQLGPGLEAQLRGDFRRDRQTVALSGLDPIAFLARLDGNAVDGSRLELTLLHVVPAAFTHDTSSLWTRSDFRICFLHPQQLRGVLAKSEHSRVRVPRR